jgi:hypothetical protein
MGLFRAVFRLAFLAGAAFAGAVAGDIVRQRVTGEEGRILVRKAGGDWSANVTPQMLLPAVMAGFRSKERGLLRAFAVAAFMSGTGGKGLGGIAGSFFRR